MAVCSENTNKVFASDMTGGQTEDDEVPGNGTERIHGNIWDPWVFGAIFSNWNRAASTQEEEID